jgi:hypothetical protein
MAMSVTPFMPHLGLDPRMESAMGIRRSDWTRRLRERPPSWPGSDDESAGRQRWLREPEPFEDRGAFEPYPGATVLEDLAGSDDEYSSLRILARYTVVRVLHLARSGLLHGRCLRTEVRVARQHLALLPAPDWERRVLDRLCGLSSDEPTPDVVDVAIIAAESAAKRGHGMGAFALYRAGYETARDNRWWQAAERTATGIARLALLNEAPYSTRLWQRRAAVLERRARRESERSEDDATR